MRNLELKDLLLEISYCTTEERFSRIAQYLKDNLTYYEVREDANARNLIVGNPRTSLVTICAHYDIVPGSCGANDNGSSCAVLLRLAVEHAYNPYLCFVFLDREESGFYGSSLHFSKHRPNLTINLDVIGGGEQLVMHNSAGPDKPCSIMNRYLELLCAPEKYDVIPTDHLPVCDTNNIMRYGLEVITFSAFPEKDAARIRETGHLSCNEVLKYMHCGPYDDIRYISFDTMRRAEKLLDEFAFTLRIYLMGEPEIQKDFSQKY